MQPQKPVEEDSHPITAEAEAKYGLGWKLVNLQEWEVIFSLIMGMMCKVQVFFINDYFWILKIQSALGAERR